MNTSEKSSTETGNGVAIIGMAGRFPGANTLDEFWQNLRYGVESIALFSDEELRASGAGPGRFDEPNYVKTGAVLKDIESFDALFFGFSPREAQLLDPQQRLFLECALEALEDAGYDSETYDGLMGVYAGAGTSRYFLFNLYPNLHLLDEFQARLGTDKDFMPTRVSYKLDLKGPSLSIQTACSTSLVAVHMACQGLLNGECDIALAGAVTIRVPQRAGYYYQEGGILSPDGHCRAFDARASGFVPGSGAGIVVLKRLEDALRDMDHIHAVIRGSAINNDGASRVGYTAPSVDGQAEVIAEAMAMAGVDPESITYVETHGTATALGDPIEIKALVQAFRAKTQKKRFCAIGSLKTNIGHLDTAAGVAGLIKTVLALKHGMVPPSLHFTQPNPDIDFAGSPFYVNTKLSSWAPEGCVRRAGVSSFGLGGTNAHLIVEESPSQQIPGESRQWQLLVLSARTGSSLERRTKDLSSHLRQHPHLDLADVAYTLKVGRRAMSHRRMLICQGTDDAVKALETLEPHRVLTTEQEPINRRIVFMFPGGGAQYVDMGLDLYRAEPVFRQEVDLCAELLRPQLGYDLREYLYPKRGLLNEGSEHFNFTSLALPALFVTEFALARLWMSWGIYPEAMIGHSLGEYVAACLAGVFSLEDALSLVVLRGRLFERLPKGAMLSLPMSEAEVGDLLNGQLSLAAVNGPSQCVLSGPVEAIDKVADALKATEVEFRRLHIEVAAHSAMVGEISKQFGEFLEKLDLKEPQVPFISNATGTWITPAEAKDAGYWVRHLRETVRFGEGLRQLFKDPGYILLEVGPGHTLSTLARQNPEKDARQIVIASARHPEDKQSDQAVMLAALGKLWLAGTRVDWSGFYAHENRQRLSLPTYPFERQRYWIDPPAQSSITNARQLSMKKKPDIADWYYVPVWKQSPLLPLLEFEGDTKQRSCWLVFRDECGLGLALIKRLRQEGQDVIAVIPGERFGKIINRLYTINPSRREDYEALLGELQSINKTPRKIVHLWTLTPNERISSDLPFLDRSQELGFYSLFFLAQAIGEQVLAPLLGTQTSNDSHEIQIAVVSNNMQDVTGQEELCPENATLLGPCRVIPQEYPGVTCRSIDVVLPELGRQEDLINQLISELEAQSPEVVIAYRGRHRWVQSFEPVRLTHRAQPPNRLREGGVYLITGGLGGIGLELAGYFAQAVRAKLILVGRTPLPNKEEWDGWLATHADGETVSSTIQKIQEMESHGAEVLTLSADVVNERQMRAVIDRALDRFGQIHGVIHAAGIRPGGIIQQKTAEMAASILAPKVKGTLILSELLRDVKLDFFVLCSSMRAIVGGAGMVDHTAANAFLDAFAHCQRFGPKGIKLSINWDSWGEVGQSVESAVPASVKQGVKERMLSKEGVEAFCRALSTSFPQVVVSIQDLQALVDYCNGFTGSKGLEQLEEEHLSRTTHSRPQLKSIYAAPTNDIEEALAEIWRETLGIEKVGIHDNFFELGGDSVISIRIIARANRLGLRLTPRRLFENQTIAQLAAIADRVQVIEPEQGLVTGALPLTPIQCWFFDRGTPDPHQFNMSALLAARRPIDPFLLDQTLRQLLSHHDALRLRFLREGSAWRQVNAAPDQLVPLTQIDLSALARADQDYQIEQTAAEFRDGLNLSAGPLLQVAQFDLGAHLSSRLLIVISHLVVDVKSWRVLLEDLQTIYQQLGRGEPIRLPAKTTSFKDWAKRLDDHAQSKIPEQDISYWLANLRKPVSPLPVDYPRGLNNEATASCVTVSLNQEETRALLQKIPKAYQTEIDDVLLTAMAKAFTAWTEQPAILVDLELDGREIGFADLDLSRTVGWFTTLIPLRLELEKASSPAEALKSVKEQLRHALNQGHNYGLLRYLNKGGEIVEQLRTAAQAQINFMYLGQVDQGLPHDSLFDPVPNFRGQSRGKRGTRSHLFQIVVRVFGGQLRADWIYSHNVHRCETVERLATEFIEALRAIIDHCLSPEAGGYTPSDFPEANLSQQELDALISEIGQSVR